MKGTTTPLAPGYGYVDAEIALAYEDTPGLAGRPLLVGNSVQVTRPTGWR